MTKAKELPSQEELRRMFDYYPETGKLVWKRREDRDSQWNGRMAGKEAGSIKKGYIRVDINNKSYQIHRVIWKLAYGTIPNDRQVDHINGDGFDNRLCNLRLVTNRENQHNRSANKGKKYKGVYKKGNGFKAEIGHKGELIYIGFFKSEEKAAMEYDKKARELHGKHARLNFPNVETLAG